MDGRRTTKRQYSEYSDFFFTQRKPEYDQDTDLQQRESTHVRWGGTFVFTQPGTLGAISERTGRGQFV